MESGVYLTGVIAGVSAVAAATTTLYRIYRPRFPVKVNCWFCDKDTKVPFGNQNCWDCPHCDQYNGFSQDGDYNKPIPAQYVEEFNHPITPDRSAITPDRSTSFSTSTDVLCSRCHDGQILKIKQLANFIPHHEGSFDEEVESYKTYLEHTYRLCHRCEERVYEEIDRQNRAIRRQYPNVGGFSDDSTNISQQPCSEDASPVSNQPWYIGVLRVVTCMMCAVYTVLCVMDGVIEVPSLLQPIISGCTSYRVLLACLSLISAISATLLAGKYRLVASDAYLCVLLLLVVMSPWLPRLPGDHHNDTLLLVSIAATMMATWSMLTPRSPRTSKVRMTVFKCRPSPECSPSTSSVLPSVSQYSQVAPSTSQTYDHAVASSVASEDNDIISDEECFSDFETMNLDSPSRKKVYRKRKSDIFTSYTKRVKPQDTVTSTTSPFLINRNHTGAAVSGMAMGRKKPLISPARFRHKPRPLQPEFSLPSTSKPVSLFSTSHHVFGSESMIAKSFWSGSLHSSVAASEDRGSLFSEPREPRSQEENSDSDDVLTHVSGSRVSTKSSVCPVDTTSNSIYGNGNHGNMANHNNTVSGTSPGLHTHALGNSKNSVWKSRLFALSAVINIILLLSLVAYMYRDLHVVNSGLHAVHSGLHAVHSVGVRWCNGLRYLCHSMILGLEEYVVVPLKHWSQQRTEPIQP